MGEFGWWQFNSGSELAHVGRRTKRYLATTCNRGADRDDPRYHIVAAHTGAAVCPYCLDVVVDMYREGSFRRGIAASLLRDIGWDEDTDPLPASVRIERGSQTVWFCHGCEPEGAEPLRSLKRMHIGSERCPTCGQEKDASEGWLWIVPAPRRQEGDLP